MKIRYRFCLKNKTNNENKITDNNNLLRLAKPYCASKENIGVWGKPCQNMHW